MRNYLLEYEGNETAAVLAMAADLMRGDRATFKAGYSLPNALGAAVEFLRPDDPGALLGDVLTAAAVVNLAMGNSNDDVLDRGI